MKIAIVHDYLNQRGGAERVVSVLHEIYPSAPIYTTILDRESLYPELLNADIRTSWMQSLPFVQKHFKKYLPLFPYAVKNFDIRGYDLVISSSSGFAHACNADKNAVHICYCYTPPRFLWDYENYIKGEKVNVFAKLVLPAVIDKLKKWDLQAGKKPTCYAAISNIVAERIYRIYGRKAEVIFPPVDVEKFQVSKTAGEYFLVVSRLNFYKRIDLPVQACNKMNLPLVIAGKGPAKKFLQSIAGPFVRFVESLSEKELMECYQKAKALIFPGTEDFGITPLEANASGKPVIAYKAGGVLDTMREGKTCIFFEEQSVNALCDAIERCQRTKFDSGFLRKNAMRFSKGNFKRNLQNLIAKWTH